MRIIPINMAKGQLEKESLALRVGALVEYENSGAPQLGLISGEKKGKWSVTNNRGKDVELSSDRLYLLQPVPTDLSNNRSSYLESLELEAQRMISDIDLEQLWEVVAENSKEFDSRELGEILWPKLAVVEHIALRRALLKNKVFFKRKKSGFEAREQDVVEELKIQVRVEEEKARKREERIASLLARIKGEDVAAEWQDLAQLAALGSGANNAKESLTLLDELIERGNLGVGGRAEDKAFRVLAAARLFSPDENLAIHRYRRARVFDPTLEALSREVGELALSQISPSTRDLTALDAISIDAEDTKDIDDAISVERSATGYRLGVHISDVAAVVGDDSPLFAEALHRATSVYCPDFKIAMFPAPLSESWLSLVANERRLSMSFLFDLDREFSITKREICRAVINVKARLNYDDVDCELFGEEGPLRNNAASRREMLHDLWSIACALEQKRNQRGSIQFPRKELVPVVDADGSVRLEEYSEESPSRKLVGEMMILANETAGLFGKEHSLPLVYRSQEAPEVNIIAAGTHIAEGPAREYFRRGLMKRSVVSAEPLPHSSLGVDAYIQVTSPIRRVVDLVNQKQLAHFLNFSAPLYNADRVMELLGSAQLALDEAQGIQREGTRYWTLKYLKQENTKELDAIIVRVDGPKPLAELALVSMMMPFHMAAKKSDRAAGLSNRLGERIKLRVDSIDPRKDIFVLSEIE